MRHRVATHALGGLLAALAMAGAVEAAGPGPVGPCAQPSCPHQPGCGGHGHPCHDPPCADFFHLDCKPLPPISFSRYADNGDYDCTRRVYGDACPRFPRLWYSYRQSYPVSHKAGVQAGEGGRSAGAGWDIDRLARPSRSLLRAARPARGALLHPQTDSEVVRGDVPGRPRARPVHLSFGRTSLGNVDTTLQFGSIPTLGRADI